MLDPQADRSLTSDSTSTKLTKLSASSAKTGEKVSVSCRRSDVVGAAADADVVVHVNKLAPEGVGKKPGNEQRDVADLFETGPLLGATAVERARQLHGQRLGIVGDPALHEPGQAAAPRKRP